MTSVPIVRFAPSPTGRIHIGNARTALLNWLFARRNGGTFVLRFDDTDFERSRAEYAESIEEDLAWLGVAPICVRRQSDRMSFYDAAAEKLKAAGRLYPAYETPEELERRRKRQQALGRPPIYDRAALRLTDADRAALEAIGPQAALAVSARPGHGALDRPGARREPHRLRLALRPGAPAGGRNLSLHACPRWSTTSRSASPM